MSFLVWITRSLIRIRATRSRYFNSRTVYKYHTMRKKRSCLPNGCCIFSALWFSNEDQKGYTRCLLKLKNDLTLFQYISDSFESSSKKKSSRSYHRLGNDILFNRIHVAINGSHVYFFCFVTPENWTRPEIISISFGRNLKWRRQSRVLNRLKLKLDYLKCRRLDSRHLIWCFARLIFLINRKVTISESVSSDSNMYFRYLFLRVEQLEIEKARWLTIWDRTKAALDELGSLNN